MPLVNNAAEGTLTIDGVDMNIGNGAWGIIGDEKGTGGYVQLWADFDVRGDDRILPSVTGVIAYQRRRTVTRHDFRLIVVGDVIGSTSAPETDTRVGLEENIEYLRENVIDPVDTATGTRSAVLDMPSGNQRAADIHVLGVTTQTYKLSECGSIWIATMHISIPSGRFMYAGSS
jgi:hypothetical protein